MSRNVEKARSNLNRFQSLKAKEAGVLESNPSLRPKFVQSVNSLPQAEKWRSTVLSEISIKLTRIQDLSLGEFQIRELNDSLNSLLREKRAWEHHIKSLGGQDYISFDKGFLHIGHRADIDLSGAYSRGYKFFGRAKELPEAKEVIEKQQKNRLKLNKEKKESKYIPEAKIKLVRPGGDYYGLYDETGVLGLTVMNPSSYSHEVDADEWMHTQKKSFEIANNYINDEDSLLHYEQKRSKEIQDTIPDNENNFENITHKIYLETPSQEEVEMYLLKRRKEALLLKLGYEDA